MRINNPRTENQIIEDSLWPDGEYSFEIAAAVAGQSKSGNDMITLNINVYAADGRVNLVKDYLLEAMALKLRRCVDVCGLAQSYMDGQLDPADFVGKTGTLILKKEEGSDGYPAKNVVKGYVIPNGGVADASKPIEATHPAFDDEIPF